MEGVATCCRGWDVGGDISGLGKLPLLGYPPHRYVEGG